MGLNYFPYSSNISIRVKIPAKNLRVEKIRVYNLQGVLVKNHDIEGVNVEIDISALKTGIYFVEGLSNEGGIFTEKLIKK